MTDRLQVARELETGLAMHRAGKIGLAESHYARVVKLEPGHTEAWHLLGVAAFQNGNAAKAIKHYRKAIELRPGFAQAWNNLAIALKSRGDLAGAADAFARALAARPEYVEAAYNLALLHEDAGRAAEAEAAYRSGLAWSGDHVDILTNLGNLLVRVGRAEEGVAFLARAHASTPDATRAGNLALARLELGEYAKARALAAEAAASEADVATWWSALGTAARLEGDADAALDPLRRAAALAPDDAGIAHELGLALAATGDDAEARRLLDRAVGLAPKSAPIAWDRALLLPALVPGEDGIDAAIESFAAGLARLEPDAEAASTAQDFHLHYLPRDTTALQSRFGDLIARSVPSDLAQPVEARASDKVRVAFVGSHFSRHTISRHFNALIAGLDAARFERHVFHCGPMDDVARSLAVERFEHVAWTPLELARRIREERFDVAVLTDFGLDPRLNLVAASRLASRQVALYGHPVTTGLASIDTFVSAEAYEPANAREHYRETLALLPGIGALPSRPDVAPDARWFAALRDERPALLCLQNLSKITPAFDAALARIVRESDARVFLFDRGAALTARWLERHDRSRVVALPTKGYAEFLGAIAACDLVLDTPWFSGGGTSLDAFGLGKPVVAWESTFARGRQTSGMLRVMAIDELIATSEDDYVARVLGLVTDRAKRDALGATIRERNAALFEPRGVVEAFAKILTAAP